MNDLPLKRTDLEISSTKTLPMSDHILMHIHGGGFIATSSSTHEVYRRDRCIFLFNSFFV
jgi:acetyl esterase/lipase